MLKQMAESEKGTACGFGKRYIQGKGMRLGTGILASLPTPGIVSIPEFKLLPHLVVAPSLLNPLISCSFLCPALNFLSPIV